MPNPVPKFLAIKRGDSWNIVHRQTRKLRNYMMSFNDGTFLDVIIMKHDEYIDDPLRKYYFKVVASMIAKESMMDDIVVHENMKLMFASEKDEKTGFVITQSVFSHESEMPVVDKERFVERVRGWAMDFFEGMYIPEKGEAYIE